MLEPRVIKITSEKIAFEAIEEAMKTGFGGDNVKLDFVNWPMLEIKLEGPGYKSTITPDMAFALVQLQKSLNRSYSLLTHGQNSGNRLTDEERRDIQFKATVKDGSSLINVDLGKFAEKLATAVADKMTPELIVITIVSVAALAGSVVAYKAFLKARTDEKTITERGATAIAMSKEETARNQILVDALTKNNHLRVVQENFDIARDDILKGTSDAKTLSVNAVLLDQETVRTAATKKRESSTELQLNGTYFVTETNLRKPDEIRIGLRRAQDGKEFAASFLDHSLDGEQIKLLQEAEWGRTAVFLSINATELRGQITGARVISVVAQPELE